MARPADWWILGALFVFVLWGLRRNLPRAVLFLAPGTLLLDSEDPPDQMHLPPELVGIAGELHRLGFVPVGSRLEKPPLAPGTTYYDYAKPLEKVFATLFTSRSGKPSLFYLTMTPANGFVITANYRRPAKDIPGLYLAGALEGFPAERIYRAHLRRVEQMGAVGEYTPQSRLEVAKTWSRGLGRTEIRQQNFQGLMWTAAILVLLAAALFGAAPHLGRR